MIEFGGLVLGALLGGVLWLLIATAAGWESRSRRRSNRSGSSLLWGPSGRTRLLGGLAAGVLLLIVTRWPVMAAAGFGLVWLWPLMFGSTHDARLRMAQLEALATWTESLRDTLAGASTLEQAIPDTATTAPPILAAPLERLVGLVRAKVPLAQALARFSDDLDDPGADRVIAALILTSRVRAEGLAATLGRLAASTREELEQRMSIFAGRAGQRRTVSIVIGITAFMVVGLSILVRSYVAPYGTAGGQIMLMVVIGVFVFALAWMRRVTMEPRMERMLGDVDQIAAAAAMLGSGPVLRMGGGR